MPVRWLFAAAVIAAFTFSPNAQIKEDRPDQERREQKLRTIDSIVSDASTLRLGENRAFVLAKAGNLLWELDRRRARDLFVTAIDELVAEQNIADEERRVRRSEDLLHSQSTRPQILNIIASRDAVLALELLVKSRPPAISRAIAGEAAKTDKVISNVQGFSYIAQSEQNLEHTLIRMAADQDPERAVRLIRDALKKGVSGETMNLLRKLAQKDAVLANKTFGEIVDSLLRRPLVSDGAVDHQTVNFAVNILTQVLPHSQRGGGENTLALDETRTRAMVSRLAGFFQTEGARYGFQPSPQIITIIERLIPGAAARLRELQRYAPSYGFRPGYGDPDVAKLLSSDAPAAALVAEAEKLTANLRRPVYETAAQRMIAAGDLAGAVGLINGKFGGDVLDEAMNGIRWHQLNMLVSKGRFDEAENFLDEFPENTRFEGLMNLASHLVQRDKEEYGPRAARILERARAMLPDSPETSQEMSRYMQLVAAYTRSDVAEAFRMMETLTPRLNEIADAAVITNGFNSGGNIRKREFVIAQGVGFGFYLDIGIFGKLYEADPGRMLRMIDTFSRPESRLTLRIALAERQ